MTYKVSAIICAAGTGERAGFGKNKLLTPLAGAPALYHTLKKFDLHEVDEVIVAASSPDYKEIKALCAPFGYNVIIGGKTRFESVKKALEKVTGDIVIIHDGARPYVTDKIIKSCINGASTFGSAVCAIPATDTTAIVYYGVITDVPKRESVYCVQTPQGFNTDAIKKAYELAEADGKTFTDDSSAYSAYIGIPHVIEGDRKNIKLTYREDFLRDVPVISAGGCDSVGFGCDTHAFGGLNKFVTLAGVKIECDSSLVAHSDGDVVIHALMDAILSACGLNDIGHYFPDTDKRYKGADSTKLLAKVMALAAESGYSLQNISITVQAEKPRLAPRIDDMRQSLSNICGIPCDRVAVAAGTCEKLGFVGEGLGITAYSTVLMKKN
ncbi:MAG: 2-C-methyl-D-erythritol 4-phosphate cytidylyltransferase [Clostridia bacterium]|nr:2-C-methyl-D-erythritol 4-phosphate cytidylyltransferase [Clostridia bacterium]